MESSNKHTEDTGQVQQVTDQAREKAGEAADQARETAQNLAGQAQDRIREQVDQRSTEAGERVGSTAQDMRSVGSELRNQGKEGPARVAEQAADRIDRAGSYLREADADRILDDVEDFGRSKPWAVLAGAAVAGFVAARFLRASSRDRYSSRRQIEPTAGTRGRSELSGAELESSPATMEQVATGRAPAGVR